MSHPTTKKKLYSLQLHPIMSLMGLDLTATFSISLLFSSTHIINNNLLSQFSVQKRPRIAFYFLLQVLMVLYIIGKVPPRLLCVITAACLNRYTWHEFVRVSGNNQQRKGKINERTNYNWNYYCTNFGNDFNFHLDLTLKVFNVVNSQI